MPHSVANEEDSSSCQVNISGRDSGAIDCAEEANHMATLISKLLGTQKPSVHCYVDNKSIVDALTSSRGYEWKLLRFKRCWNEGNSLRFHGFQEISQLANCLTKTGASSEELLEAISN